MDKRVKAHLLLQDIVGRGAGRVGLEREVHALMPAVLLGMAGRDALEPDAEPEPPDGEFAQAVQRVG
jgi:hypothetical protein